MACWTACLGRELHQRTWLITTHRNSVFKVEALHPALHNWCNKPQQESQSNLGRAALQQHILHKKVNLNLNQQRSLLTCPLSGTTRVSLYQKIHSPTHTYPGYQSSFMSFLHLQRSIASSLFNLHVWQSFCTTSLSCPLWFTSWSTTLHFILHTYLHPVTVFFLQHMPIPMQPVLLQYQDYVI